MPGGVVLEILAVAAFLALNGFFVAAEFALVKLRATYQSGGKHREKEEKQDLVAEAVSKIDRYLSVTQLGITLASLGLGWLGEPAIARNLEGLYARIGTVPMSPAVHTAITGISFALLTYSHVLLGELVPKLLAIQKSAQIARFSAWPLRISYYLLLPGLWILEACSRAILGHFGVSMDTHSEAALSEDEILGILAAHVARGKGAEAKQELIRRMMRFSARTARQAMIPRVDVVHLPVTSPGSVALELLRTSEYSRLPLSKGREIDQVIGYLYWKDLLREPHAASLTNLEKLRRDVLFVPEPKPLVEVLREMQRTNTPFAVVVDEYGGTSGILTMEDLLEEIVGEIRDESDVELQRIEEKSGFWEVDGSVLLDELAGVGLDVGEHDHQDTLGGLISTRLGRIPRLGDTIELGHCRIEVIALARRRVTRVRVTPLPPASLST
ncbi:MAG: hemolysin family protein [Myxococcales bacterium]|nr:hemolysin family protein [Myxococcales bacterium]